MNRKIDFLLVVLILSFLANIIFAQNRDFGGIKSELDPDGFGDVKWGTSISAFSDLANTEGGQPGFIECYKKINEDLDFEGVALERVEYCFWEEKLYYVNAITKDFENATRLRDLFEKKYGEGLQVSNDPDGERFIYIWGGPKTSILLSCEDNTMPYSGRGTLFMQSFEVDKEIGEYSKQQAKEKRLVDDKGRLHGLMKFTHPDGYLWRETNYKHGKKHGISRDYYPNGKLKYEETYKNGKRVKRKYYDEEGNLIYEGH